MSTDTNTESMLETARSCFLAARTAVLGMADGGRMQLKELAQMVGTAVSMEPKHVLGFVNHFAHNTDIGHITRGKGGGIKKGLKPVKVVKPKRVKKAVAPVDTTVADTAETTDESAAAQ
jgi:hypothetical protein